MNSGRLDNVDRMVQFRVAAAASRIGIEEDCRFAHAIRWPNLAWPNVSLPYRNQRSLPTVESARFSVFSQFPFIIEIVS